MLSEGFQAAANGQHDDRHVESPNLEKRLKDLQLDSFQPEKATGRWIFK